MYELTDTTINGHPRLIYTEDALRVPEHLRDLDAGVAGVDDVVLWLIHLLSVHWWVPIAGIGPFIVLHIIYTYLEGKYRSGPMGYFRWDYRSPSPAAARWRWWLYRFLKWVRWFCTGKV